MIFFFMIVTKMTEMCQMFVSRLYFEKSNRMLRVDYCSPYSRTLHMQI